MAGGRCNPPIGTLRKAYLNTTTTAGPSAIAVLVSTMAASLKEPRISDRGVSL